MGMDVDDRQLFRVHRTMGYPVGYSRLNDGSKIVILQTGEYRHEVGLAHLMIAVTIDAVQSMVRLDLVGLIRHAIFLGVPSQTLSDLFQETLSQLQEEKANAGE